MDSEPSSSGEEDFIVPLLMHYQHQDDAFWRAVTWIIPIEAGVITGSFVRPGWPGLCLVVIGTTLIGCFANYARKCWADANVNVDLIDRAVPDAFKDFRLTATVPFRQTGRMSLISALFIVLATNLTIAILELHVIAGCCCELTDAFFTELS